MIKIDIGMKKVGLFDFYTRRSARKLLIEQGRSVSLERGTRMAVWANDRVGADIFVDGVYDGDGINCLVEMFRRIKLPTLTGTAIDVGANIGNHTLKFARLFKHVEAFEPDDLSNSLLVINTHRCANVRVWKVGLGSERGMMTLYENPGNFGSNSFVFDKDRASSAECEIRQLDQYIDIINNVLFIKIDVEGMEAEVLDGASQIIEKFKPIIAFEQQASEFYKVKSETRAISILRDNGYLIGVFEKRTQRGEARTPFERIWYFGYELFFGRLEFHRVVFEDRIPVRNYPLLIAIPAEIVCKNFG